MQIQESSIFTLGGRAAYRAFCKDIRQTVAHLRKTHRIFARSDTYTTKFGTSRRYRRGHRRFKRLESGRPRRRRLSLQIFTNRSKIARPFSTILQRKAARFRQRHFKALFVSIGKNSGGAGIYRKIYGKFKYHRFGNEFATERLRARWGSCQ